MQLTTEQKRRRIAEANGLKNLRIVHKPSCGAQLVHGNETMVPAYFDDLNACHEMEKILWEKHLWSEYRHNLRKKYGDEDISATASERAETFGQTLNLW